MATAFKDSKELREGGNVAGQTLLNWKLNSVYSCAQKLLCRCRLWVAFLFNNYFHVCKMQKSLICNLSPSFNVQLCICRAGRRLRLHMQMPWAECLRLPPPQAAAAAVPPPPFGRQHFCVCDKILQNFWIEAPLEVRTARSWCNLMLPAAQFVKRLSTTRLAKHRPWNAQSLSQPHPPPTHIHTQVVESSQATRNFSAVATLSQQQKSFCSCTGYVDLANKLF